MVSASREIAAGAGRIFELIADPAAQPRWDGNDNLAGAAAGQRVRRGEPDHGETFRPVSEELDEEAGHPARGGPHQLLGDGLGWKGQWIGDHVDHRGERSSPRRRVPWPGWVAGPRHPGSLSGRMRAGW